MGQNSPQSVGTPTRRSRGASIALVLVCVIGLLGLLGFFVFNYSRIFGAQREAQTAIDAAALEAAKQASNIWIPTDLGPIGLTNQGPTTANQNTPVEGVNTALATARLDYLIASDLGNSPMQLLAARDLTYLETFVVPQLESAIQNNLANITQQAQAVYQENAARDFRGGNQTANAAVGNLTVQFGAFNNNNVTTTVRTPNGAPNGLTGANTTGAGNNQYYKANVTVPVPGYGNVMFGAVGDSPRIVDNGDFSTTIPANFIPTAVQVQATSTLQGQAGNGQTNVNQQKLTNIATALCGSGIVTNTSTTYCISFPGGFPADPSFSSPKGILNSASLSSATDAPSSVDQNFNSLGGAETWFQAPPNGTIPPGPTANVGFTAGYDNKGNPQVRTQDYPPVALAFGLYDWIRSMGLRIERTSMVAALSADLTQFLNQGAYNHPIQFTWDGMTPAYAAPTNNSTPQNSIWLALPQSMSSDPRYQAVTNMANDPNGIRNVVNAFGYEFPGNVAPASAAALIVTRTGATTTDGQNIVELGSAQNAVTSTNHAASCVNQAGKQAAATFSQKAAAETAQAAAANAQAQQDQTQINALLAQIAKIQSASPPGDVSGLQAQVASLQADATAQQAKANALSAQAQKDQATANLATTCAANAAHIQDQTYAMIANFQALTALGVANPSKDGIHFTIAGSAFTSDPEIASDPASFSNANSPTAAQIQQMVTNISKASGASDPLLTTGSGLSWASLSTASPPAPNLSCFTYKGSSAQQNPPIPAIPPIAHNGDLLTQAANAQQYQLTGPGLASPPNNNLMFLFNIQGDYQKTSSCNVTITPLPNSPFWNNSTSNGQAFYYAPTVLTCKTGNLQVSWSCIARDNCANGKFFTTASEKNNVATGNPQYCQGGAENMNLPAGACPTLGGEFRVGCPIPAGIPPYTVCGADTVTSSGQNTAPVCPPPPPHMG